MRPGRPPAGDVLTEVVPVSAAREGECVVGADVGGTRIEAGALDGRGAVILRRSVPSPAADGERMVATVLELVSSCVDSARGEGFRVLAIGIGAAGFVLHREGVILESPNIAWSDVPLKAMAARETGLPAFLDNDANAAAAGEHFAGACTGVDDFVCLTLGTGVGGGVYIDGRLYRGFRGTAAEIGHMTIDQNGPECGCGRRGCLEAMASGTALAREAARLAGERDTVLLEMGGGSPGSITGEMVSRAADAGDPVALEAFRYLGRNLGVGIVNLIHVFDPEVVVVGGGVARSGRHLLGELEASVREHGIPSLVSGTAIALSSLGGDAGLVGSGAIAWEGIGAAP